MARPGRLDPPFGAYTPTAGQRAIITLARHSFLRFGDWRPLMVWMVMGRRTAPLDAVCQGLKFRLHIRDNTAEQGILFNNSYNEDELAFLKDGLAPGGVFVDVGANIGQFSLRLAGAVGASGQVLAVEPDPIIRARLEANLVANDASGVIVIPFALGDHEGEVSFIQDGQNVGHNRVGEAGGIKVAMKPLLAVLSDAGVTRIDAFKIDVEGFEDKVLDPFFEAAPRSLWPRRVVIEKLHAGNKDTPVERMMAMGYRKQGGNRANLFLVLEDEA